MITLPFNGKAGFNTFSISYGRKNIVWRVNGKEVLRTPSAPFTKKLKAAISIWDASFLGSWAGSVNWNQQSQFDFYLSGFQVKKI
jgi:hypothetical protein